MEIIIIVAVLVVLAFFIGKRFGSSESSEIKVTFESGGFDEYDDEEDEDRDSWEGGFWEASDPKKLTAHLEIE